MGFLQSIFLCNNIIHSYIERITINDAHKLFGEMTEPNVVSWTNLISGFTQMGKLTQGVSLFRRMQDHSNGEGKEGRCIPNCFTFGSILKGCTLTKDLQTGMQIHCSIVKFGFENDTFIASTLVDMYGKCGQIEGSWRVFSQTQDKDVVTWTSMITSFANQMHPEFKNAAFILFKEMIRNGIWPLGITFSSLVKVFNEPRRLNQAKHLHGCLIKLGIEVDFQLGSSLVSMYGKCEGIDEAVRIFLRLDQKDVVSWTSLLVAYLNNGFYVEAINVFSRMVVDKIPVDPFVVAGVVGVCSGLEKMASGKEVHGFAIRKDLISDVSVGNSFITFYGRCGDVKKAKIVFQGMEVRDAISWTALLTCFTQAGYAEEALFLFQKMLLTGLSLPVFVITCAMRACSIIASLSVANQLHSRTIKMGFSNDLSVRNSLITMYAKCGDIDIALRLFNSMSNRDTISWNAIIAALSQHGFGKEALELFHLMKMEGFQPDDFTLLGVLVSCNNVGLVNEGFENLKSMTTYYNLKPKMEHYACFVSLLGRAGRLDDVMEFINSIPSDPDVMIWEALLASCRVQGNIKLGKFAAEKILQMKPEDPSAYILLSSIHASMGVWDKKADVLMMMRDQKVRRQPSQSWIEVKGMTHVFYMEDKSHPLTPFIYSKLEELNTKLKEAGYVPNVNLVLHYIEPEQKEYSLLQHSEKLALAFGLITTAKGSTIRIMQNLRCCGDCHAAFKLISKIEDCKIVLRDSNRFHHFFHGACTCKDYW